MLLLPVSEQTVDALIAAGTAGLEELIAALGVAEVAALITLQGIASVPPPLKGQGDGYASRIERDLAAGISTLGGLDDADRVAGFVRGFRPALFNAARDRLERDGPLLMSQQEVDEQAYLDERGEWRWNYHDLRPAERSENLFLARVLSREQQFTDEQNRVLYDIRANLDQSLDISGYAGCGKTLLISYLPQIVPQDSSLYLTMYEGQRASMARRLPQQVLTTTFATLSRKVLQAAGLLGTDSITMDRITRRFEARPERLIAELGIQPLAGLSVMEVLRCVMTTTAKYSYSDHRGIRTEHVPRCYSGLSGADKQVITGLARNLWSQLEHPAADWLPIKGYHLIKRLALSELSIPADYSHLIVDESHDLPRSVVQIIDRAEQAVITLGDRYQSLRYRRIARQRAEGISIREMAYSMRAGDNVSDTVNTICAHHPDRYMQPFHGSTEKKTRLVAYAEFRIPECCCAILSKSGFYLFSIMQRLSVRGARFHILGHADLLHLMGDAIKLFHHGSRATHRELRQYASWDDFMQARSDPVTDKIDHLFRRGYNITDLQNAMARAEPRQRPDGYVIGRIEDARNREFSRVLLLSDVLRPAGRSRTDVADYINHIYTGFSRARDEIILPEDITGRVADSLSGD